MKKFWSLLYRFKIFPFIYFSIIVLSKFNAKIRKGLKERKGLFDRLERFRRSLGDREKVVLFHCVSMGELQQAKPLVKKIKERFSEIKIVVSFLSPSGYDNFKESPEFDFKIYLPVDSLKNAEKFFSILKPSLWIIVKHDIWPNHLKACSENKIPIVLIDANLPGTSKRILPIAKSFFRSFYKDINLIMPVSEDDAERFLMIYPHKDRIIPTGDTRYDQVFYNSQIAKDKDIPYLSFYNGRRVFVCGSVWKEDLQHIIPALSKLLGEYENLYTVIVPHEPDFEHLDYIDRELNKLNLSYNKYSELKDIPSERILVIDRIGLLAGIYKYSYITYVGGSFTTGVHNVMEPAIFKSPILFGPEHNNSFEALEMVKRGGAFPINNENDIYYHVSSFLDAPQKRQKSGSEASSVVMENLGATERIMNYVEDYIRNL